MTPTKEKIETEDQLLKLQQSSVEATQKAVMEMKQHNHAMEDKARDASMWEETSLLKAVSLSHRRGMVAIILVSATR